MGLPEPKEIDLVLVGVKVGTWFRSGPFENWVFGKILLEFGKPELCSNGLFPNRHLVVTPWFEVVLFHCSCLKIKSG